MYNQESMPWFQSTAVQKSECSRKMKLVVPRSQLVVPSQPQMWLIRVKMSPKFSGNVCQDWLSLWQLPSPVPGFSKSFLPYIVEGTLCSERLPLFPLRLHPQSRNIPGDRLSSCFYSQPTYWPSRGRRNTSHTQSCAKELSVI